MDDLKAGVYEHKGNYYLLLGLCRMHDETGAEFVAYIPLRTKPEWSGTARIALRSLSDFMKEFTFVSSRLP